MLTQTALDLDGVIFDYEKTFQKEELRVYGKGYLCSPLKF